MTKKTIRSTQINILTTTTVDNPRPARVLPVILGTCRAEWLGAFSLTYLKEKEARFFRRDPMLMVSSKKSGPFAVAFSALGVVAQQHCRTAVHALSPLNVVGVALIGAGICLHGSQNPAR